MTLSFVIVRSPLPLQLLYSLTHYLVEGICPLHLSEGEELHLPSVQSSDFGVQNLLEIGHQGLVHVALAPAQLDGKVVSCAYGQDGHSDGLVPAALAGPFSKQR